MLHTKPELKGDNSGVKSDNTGLMLESFGCLQVYLSTINDELTELKTFKEWALPIPERCKCGNHD